jgi:enoyl-CoA hydratase
MEAEEAYRLGMVNHVVPRDDLTRFTEELATKIASKPLFGLKMTKEAINQTLDAQGQWTAMQSVFTMHTLAHTHWREVGGAGLYQGESAEARPGSKK